MEWILVLVLSTSGGNATMTSISGFKSLSACSATLENAKKVASDKYNVSPMIAGEMYKYSICVERGK